MLTSYFSRTRLTIMVKTWEAKKEVLLIYYPVEVEGYLAWQRSRPALFKIWIVDVPIVCCWRCYQARKRWEKCCMDSLELICGGESLEKLLAVKHEGSDVDQSEDCSTDLN